MYNLRITPNPQKAVWAIHTTTGYDLIQHAALPHELTKSDLTGEWLISIDVPKSELERLFSGLGPIQFVETEDYRPCVREAERLLADRLGENCEAGTRDNYFKSILNFWKEYPGIPPKQLTSDQAQAYLFFLASEKKTNSILNLVVSALKFFFRHQQGQSVSLQRPKHTPPAANVLAHTEIEKLLEAAEKLRDRFLVLLVYGSGLRVSELRQLEIDHLDLQAGKIRVPGKPDRWVPLSPNLQQAWREYKRSHCGERYVFEGQKPAQPMDTRTLQLAFQRLCNQAALTENPTLQTLRHSHGVWLVSRGHSNQQIMERMGLQSANAVRVYRKWYGEMSELGGPV